MNIPEIEIENFKSFEDISIELNDFNAVIGASASGKSNFIESFLFLKEICRDFENIQRREYVQNLNLGSTRNTRFKVKIGDGKTFLKRFLKNQDEIQYKSIEYELCINFDSDFYNESVKFIFNINNEKNSLILVNSDFKITAEFENKNNNLDLEEFVPESLLNIVNNNLNEKKGLIINSPLACVLFTWTDYFKSIKYYAFDSKLSHVDGGTKKAVLSENCQNLASVLEKILKDIKKRESFFNLVSILMPYIKDISVFKLKDNRRMFKISEKYNEKSLLSTFISDGTMNMLALICALYFESGGIILIEEHERNIHPSQFIQLVSMFKEVSRNKQVIITTHSPEILNNCDLNDIHLITRDDEGFSKFSKPCDSHDVKEFIDELGIGQVFVDGYLDFRNE